MLQIPNSRCPLVFQLIGSLNPAQARSSGMSHTSRRKHTYLGERLLEVADAGSSGRRRQRRRLAAQARRMEAIAGWEQQARRQRGACRFNTERF